MKLIDIIVGFFKKIFSKKNDGECGECYEKDVCQTVDRSKKYALIVGVEFSKWGTCAGSNRDSDTMLGLIKQYVDGSHIVKLNNGQATTIAVRKALKEQIAKVPEDGLLIFTYSGHGGQTQKKSNASNETDGKDEFLCLYDGYILDDELWTIFGECKGRILFIVDACHSSTMYRLPSEEIDETLDDAENRLPLDTPFFARFENARSTHRMLVISGCGEETVSWGDSQGGIMTNAMKKHFNKCLSYKEWWNAFRNDPSFKRVKQIPYCTNIGGFPIDTKVFN